MPSLKHTLLGTCLHAIDENIERISTEEPTSKVGLVSFGSSVYMAGDCSKPVVEISERISHDKK
jgi:hypothetical protein